MEPTLMVVGLNQRTAPLSVRERFWIGEKRRYEVLRQLRKAEGIDEVFILSTGGCTEFFLWAAEPTLAANSLLQFLTAAHGLKLSEWEHFYRLLDDAALAHIFRLASGLDSLRLDRPEISRQLESAWEQARAVGAVGRFLNTVLEAALRVGEQVRRETEIEQGAGSLPEAAVHITRQIFGSVKGRKVLLLGSGEVVEATGRKLLEQGASSLVVIDQSPDRAQELALALGARGATMADRWKQLLGADIVITASGCPHVILTREEAERITAERNRVALLILDVAMPRDVDPEVRGVDGILLHDIETLEQVCERDSADSETATELAETMIAREVLAFRGRLRVQNGAPTAMNLRRRLDELCRQELDSFITQCGPFSREQDRYLHAITGQLTQTIASFLARELKEVPEKEEQERMAAAVARLFHLESPQEAIAGTISKQDLPQGQGNAAVNY